MNHTAMTDEQNTTKPCRPACLCPTCLDRRQQALEELNSMSEAPFDRERCRRDAAELESARDELWKTHRLLGRVDSVLHLVAVEFSHPQKRHNPTLKLVNSLREDIQKELDPFK